MATEDERRPRRSGARTAGEDVTCMVSDLSYVDGLPTSPGVPEWLILGAYTAIREYDAGRASTCLHVHPGQMYAAAAWHPGLVVCGACSPILRLSKGSDLDRTCDGCGRIVAGGPDDLMYPGVAILGPLVYAFGACQDCRYPQQVRRG